MVEQGQTVAEMIDDAKRPDPSQDPAAGGQGAPGETPPGNDDKEKAGLLKDLQGEREARQQLQKEVGDLNLQIAELRGIVSAQQKPDQPKTEDPLSGLEDSDYIKKEDLKRTIEAITRQNEAAATQRTSVDEDRRMHDSMVQARAELTIKSCGEGLDYDTVIREGFRNLSRFDQEAVKAAANPAQEAYKRCISLNPHLQERAMAARAAKLLDQTLPERGPVNKTGGGAGGGSGSAREQLLNQAADEQTTYETLLTMSDEELTRLEGKLRGW